MVDLIRVDNDVLWGKLVRSWATGVNHLVPGQPAPKPPETLDDLKAQCQKAGIGITIPSYIKGLQLVRMPKETLALRIPAKELVEGIETDLKAPGAKYVIPQYYDDAYGASLNVPNPDERVKLQTCRIGEYSISLCG
jgi:hypothetical protein